MLGDKLQNSEQQQDACEDSYKDCGNYRCHRFDRNTFIIVVGLAIAVGTGGVVGWIVLIEGSLWVASAILIVGFCLAVWCLS